MIVHEGEGLAEGSAGEDPVARRGNDVRFFRDKRWGYVGAGHAVNPSTGQPYASNLVAEGDFARVLAEFWADGPHSETPPGHWQVLANEISDHPATVKRIGGRGEKVDDLEWDVKLSFALSAATHDAACAAWSLKRYYEGVRPITMIRHLGAFGQSSDPGSPQTLS
jgi:hypothetical protein